MYHVFHAGKVYEASGTDQKTPVLLVARWYVLQWNGLRHRFVLVRRLEMQ
jgi:hypothetical protein